MHASPIVRALALGLTATIATACVDAAEEEDLGTSAAALDVPVGTAVRVIGGEEVLLRSDLYTFPHFNPNPGSNERRLWVPDGPPRAYVDVHGQTRLIIPHYLTYAFVGWGLNGVALNAGDVVSDSAQSNNWGTYNDATWPWSPWRLPDGRLAVINHQEYHCLAHGTCSQDRWYPSLTFSMAYDGKHIGTPSTGIVAKSAYPFIGDATVVSGAYSDPTNVLQQPINGHYYMVTMFKTNNGAQIRNCVMRTNNILDPASWRVFDGAGYNGQPQNGVTCPDVMSHYGGSWAPGSLSWSYYLNRAVYLAFGDWNGRQGFWIRTSLNDDLTAWSAPSLVYEARLSWGDNGAYRGRPMNVYPSFLDPDAPSLGTSNYDRIGQSPYLYWVRTFGQETRREVVRVRVRFEAGVPEIANRMQGLYRIGGGGHYSNGVGTYCSIWSMEQLVGCGWGYDFWALPPFNDHGPNALQGGYSGRCTCGVPPVPFGCYRIGGGGFFSNGAGRSCPFLGGQMPALCGTTNFWALPARNDHGLNAVDGQCSG